ncbi:MAG: mechanosensitive ion channel protein MscS [Saprospiraceae bacterium]|nr:MAG: mechanosensitive ion channel protein MscS [Saprospiraceae bacterium]
MDQFSQYFENPIFQKIAAIIIGAIVIFLLTGLIKNIIPRYVKETNTRYRTRKFINYVGYLLVILMIMVVYSSQLSGLTVFLGVAGAGIAFALQEVIASVAGFIAINFSNFYNVGDRVMLGGIKGDVVDIGVLRTSMMQIGDWVNGDLYNGKIVRIANSFIFKEPVYNYSGDFPFLWDEVVIPIKTQGDYNYASEKFMEILHEVQGDYAKGAQKYWSKMTEKMLVEDAQVAPMVTMAFDENWISFTLRFVVDYKKRRGTKHLIYTKALDAIRNSGGKMAVASAAMEITAFTKKENPQ